MGWFDDNHPCGEAHRPGGYMNPLPDFEPSPVSKKVVHKIDAALKRQGSQKCGHTRGATLAQCHKCQAELREYTLGMEMNPDSYLCCGGHGGYGFDGAGRAEYEFDTSQDGSHAKRQPVSHTDTTAHGSEVAEHWCAACDDKHPLARFSTFQLRRAGIPSDPAEFFERRREAVLDSDDYQEAREERREARQDARREARRLKRRQARLKALSLPQKKKQRVDECESSGESDNSDESEASDQEAAVDEYLTARPCWEKENFDEDEFMWGQDNCPPCFCIDVFEGFYQDAYQCDDDDYWQQPRISTLAWDAATKKGISKDGGSLRTAADEAVLEEIETRLEASSAWPHELNNY
jgi:hypothetical protein